MSRFKYAVEAKVRQGPWVEDEEPGATVEIIIDGHVVAEAIITEVDHHAGPRPRLLIRGVVEQHDPGGLGFERVVFPVSLSYAGDRFVEVDDA